MMNAITLLRETGEGKYSDVIDAAEFLGVHEYGSATNAIAVMVRKSPLFHAARAAMAKGRTETACHCEQVGCPASGSGQSNSEASVPSAAKRQATEDTESTEKTEAA